MVLFFALASDLMFFVALVSAFFARQSSGHFSANNTWEMDWHPIALPPILWINTALIVLSSLTIEIGRRHFFREIDVMEGGGGSAAYHIHFGDQDGEGADGPGQEVNTSGGTHTFGVLWTTTSVTFVYDGVDVGTIDEALDSPMYIVMENSYSSADPTVFPTTMDVRYVRVWN